MKNGTKLKKKPKTYNSNTSSFVHKLKITFMYFMNFIKKNEKIKCNIKNTKHLNYFYQETTVKKKPLYVVWFFVNSQALMHDMSYGSSKFIKSCSKMAMRNMIPDPTTRPHSCRIKWKNGFSPFFVPRAVNSGS